jgi:hypothetical protein
VLVVVQPHLLLHCCSPRKWHCPSGQVIQVGTLVSSRHQQQPVDLIYKQVPAANNSNKFGTLIDRMSSYPVGLSRHTCRCMLHLLWRCMQHILPTWRCLL